MMFLSRAESSYLHQHLSVVRHVTLDPEGPGVLRIHLLPCKKARRNVPFVALLNGQDILPLSVSWAILLAGLMDALQPFEGKEITEDQWAVIAAQAVETAAAIPLDRIVLETDCPYMSPEPFRGKRNDPGRLYRMAEKLAEIRGLTVEEIHAITMENGKKLYRM